MATMSPWPPCPQDDHVPISTMSPWPPRPQGHTVAQGGLLLLGTLGLWVLEGGARTLGTPPGTLNASRTPRWDLASAFFFSTTLLTTVGYGPVAPLSPGGKAFCLAYAALGVPFTVLTLAVVARWLSVPVTRWPRRYLRTRWGWSPRGAAGLHLGLLAGAVAGGFVLLPAAALWALGGSGSFLDAVFFCGMAVTTVGLGDAAGAPEGQPPRHLYRVALAAYLLLGVTAALLLLAAFQQLLELHGVSAALRPPPDPPEEDGGLLDEGGQ
ncbi:potassium channel subfamily K member 6-like [Anas platyrhynchos]|uniref:potassium channel subfamily K member 6-like n=1 Tax=Anas platyrhynchos TaxID=8839 RepID=UPI003AF2ADE2